MLVLGRFQGSAYDVTCVCFLPQATAATRQEEVRDLKKEWAAVAAAAKKLSAEQAALEAAQAAADRDTKVIRWLHAMETAAELDSTFQAVAGCSALLM